MPALTLHLLTLTPPTTPESFIAQLSKLPETKIVVASRPRQTVIHPNILDANPLASTNWDLLLLLQPTNPASTSTNPIPPPLQSLIKSEYKITAGIPSKLLAAYPTKDKILKAKPQPALTGSLSKALSKESKSTSQNLELSPQLIAFMDELCKTHNGPVTMLNLLHFNHPNGKKSYFNYGQAFIPVAGKRGGDAKIVGNVVRPADGAGDSRGENGRPSEEWWNEISIVHYPSIRHFCDMLAGEDYQGINEEHRLSALRDTFLLCTTEFDLEGVASSKL
ncbi:hypothetical protein PENANT_c016G00649 [Penicillium antarcticum]|uniref:Uncharacterized protein n=1 Tax=Penicillium antarcticum TaxID=416450 RepID=A0A1V6Q457_9EURO|nr:uncharacterized protein N7508_001341 [Penicillium antarcticum]KAJ5316833.1 hypothetical protein N7508_001341 [Penicillium antarcticum]OQD83516.1 hypothetical protein PENANT_c016G00649 [Penicillium antarcticum]